MSFKNGFADIPIFDSSNWLSWSTRMSQFLMANKVWSYVTGTYPKPAPIRETISALASSHSATTTTLGPVTNGKENANWVNDNGSMIGYIKIKCQEAIVTGIPTTADTSKKVWDDLKEKYNKASAASVLMEIHKAFSFRLSGGDPTSEIQKLAAMFACLEQHGFTVPDFIQASILIITIPQKWDQISTWLLSYYLLNKLKYGIVANAIIGEHQHLAEVSQPLQLANKISAVKHKPDHPPFWKGKSKDKQPAASGNGSSDCSKEKKGQSHAEKKVKECRDAAKECQHSHMAEMVIAVDPSAPIASTLTLPPAPKPLLVITTINSNGIIISVLAFIPKKLPAAIAAKPIPRRYTGSTETRPGIWVNAEKACDLADHMEVTPTISTLTLLTSSSHLRIFP